MKKFLLLLFSMSSFLWGKISTQLQAQKPNILFCIADDASFEHFGANGCSWVKTPNFDKIASQGVLFTKAYTPNSKCTPSRSCIITGRNSWQLGDAANLN